MKLLSCNYCGKETKDLYYVDGYDDGQIFCLPCAVAETMQKIDPEEYRELQEDEE